MKVDFYASLIHYAHHLIPIWEKIPKDKRGKFYLRYPLSRRIVIEDSVEGAPPLTKNVAVTASWADSQQTYGMNCVLVEHGVGMNYGDRHSSNPGGRNREHIKLFICPNYHTVEENKYYYPRTRGVAIGCPKLDKYLPERPHTRSDPPVVAISFHWNNRQHRSSMPAFDYYKRQIAELPQDIEVWGHAHPRYWKNIKDWYSRAGIKPVENFDDVLEGADIYLTDNSSTLYEAAAIGKPVIAMNAPWYDRKANIWPRFWHLIPGIQVDHPLELRTKIDEALEDKSPWPEERKRVSQEIYTFLDGTSSERAARAIINLSENVNE